MTAPAVIDRLLTHQRAELGLANAVRAWSLGLQFVLAVLGAASVLLKDGSQLVALAVVSALVLTAWLIVDSYYRRYRSAGDQARRLLLVTSGLGEEVEEIFIIRSEFTAGVAKLPQTSIDQYFASTATAGPRRLAEMLDESAFFTGDLQRKSSEAMLLGLFITLVVVVVGWLTFAPLWAGSIRLTVARIALALSVFLLSSDVLGAAFAHGRTARAMGDIRYRLSAGRGRGYPFGDVLQAMADYNAAVESAPLPLPGLYQFRRAELTRTWEEYKRDTGLGKATGGAQA